jgi:hypothetical protein
VQYFSAASQNVNGLWVYGEYSMMGAFHDYVQNIENIGWRMFVKLFKAFGSSTSLGFPLIVGT